MEQLEFDKEELNLRNLRNHFTDEAGRFRTADLKRLNKEVREYKCIQLKDTVWVSDKLWRQLEKHERRRIQKSRTRRNAVGSPRKHGHTKEGSPPPSLSSVMLNEGELFSKALQRAFLSEAPRVRKLILT